MKKITRIGIGGPVGSGKTALVERLCKRMRETYDIAVGEPIDVIFVGGVERFTVVGTIGFGNSDSLAGTTIAAFDKPEPWPATMYAVWCEPNAEAQKKTWLPKLASGEILPTAVFTEPNAVIRITAVVGCRARVVRRTSMPSLPPIFRSLSTMSK